MDNEKDYKLDCGSEMTDREFVEKKLIKPYREWLTEIEARNDEDYEIDSERWGAYTKAVELAIWMANEFDGEFIPQAVRPREGNAVVQVNAMNGFALDWMETERVIDAINGCDTISVLPFDGRVSILLSFNDVYRKKQNE